MLYDDDDDVEKLAALYVLNQLWLPTCTQSTTR